LICSSGSDPARFVAALESAAPSYTDVTCGPGEVMVGLHGTTFSGFGFTVVSRIGAQCQSLSGGVITNAGPAGGAGGGYSGGPFSLTCPSGQAVTGVVGGAGEVVDSIALVCAPGGLVSRWPFDGDTNDIVGSNNAIATSALTYEAGRYGSGVSFGPGGFVDIADDPSLNLQRLTLSAWVNPAGPNTTGDVVGDIIINKATDFGNRVGAFLSWRADGRFIFGLGGAPSTQSANLAGQNVFVDSALLASDPSFPAGQFYHVAATYDGATMRLYVNGLAQGDLAYTTTIPYNTDPRSIGSNPPRFRHVARTWKGVIDDVRVYSRPLSPAEVLELATVFVPGTAGGTANTNCLPGGSCVLGPAGAGGTAPVNTGVSVNPGTSVTLTATGQVVVGGDNPGPYGPAGTSPYAFWPQWAVLEPSLNQFALVARIGSGPWQLVGNGPTVLSATGPSAAGGVLQLAVNDSGYDDNTGGFTVTVTPNP
jgi:hypothetical protein